MTQLLQKAISFTCMAGALCLWGAPTFAQGPEFKHSEIEFFEKKVRPLLEQHCLSCHGRDPDKIRGGLKLTSRERMLVGGDSGPAIVVGEPDNSLLIESIEYDSYEMPPTGKLTDDQIAIFRKWIAMGAPDPRKESTEKPAETKNVVAGKDFWSFQPLQAPAVPRNLNSTQWVATDIDRFVVARMEQNGLRPASDADRFALLRRLYLTLTGLPPDEQQLISFAASQNPIQEDLETVVDDLLSSSHFGERWGRHWLDVARFAESSGGGRSLMFPEAWRYRDYVIESFNQDKPFDLFIREQIAGDLLPSVNQQQRNEHLTATGFLALGPTNYEQQDKELLTMEVIDEQIDTIGRAFLGLTLGCARCHDHKFDPIPTRDYYALAAIFKNTKTLVPGNVSSYVKTPLATKAEVARYELHKKQVSTLTKKLGELKKQKATLQKATDHDADNVASMEASITQLNKEIAILRNNAPAAIQHAMSVCDEDQISEGYIHIRGDVRNRGAVVPRGFISIICNDPSTPVIPEKASGRMELANWIASDNNPLTARVYVNRIWHHLMGEGLVPTADNFGQMGQRPSHPELLDYLATEFVNDGWSTKRLIKRIVMSHVFRLKSGISPGADPGNRFLSVHTRRRADAEVLRDSILFVSGQLDKTPGGLTIRKLAEYDLEYTFDTNRRSVYVPAFRNSMLDMFEVFDMANPNLVVGSRNTSTLPTQALFMMNSSFVIEQSRKSAERLLLDVSGTDRQLVEIAFLRVLNRKPSDEETRIALQYINSGETLPADDREQAWAGLFHSLFASLEFRYIN